MGEFVWEWSKLPTYEGMLQAIEWMNCGLLVEDEDGHIVYANRRILEWSGYSAAELEGAPVEVLIPEELRDVLAEERRRALAGDDRTRLSAFRRRDGRTFPIAVAPHRMQRVDDHAPVVLALVFDLGEVQTARPVGASPGSLAGELAGVAMRLQAMAFSAAVGATPGATADHPVLRQLTAREREVLEHLMQGSRVPAIASSLFISQSTVRNHLKAIYRKLDVSSQSELIEKVRALARPDGPDDATTRQGTSTS